MAKKYWSIYARSKEAMTQGIQTSKGTLNFGGKTMVNTSDERLVKEIGEKHKTEAYAVHDEQLSKAKDSGSWDVISDSKGTRVKNLHNYTFSATKPKPKTYLDKLKAIIIRYSLSNYLWFWEVEHKGVKEKGIRFFGKEFTW